MNLTTLQRQAVEATERDVLVIAGAGSGKTRVLAARVQHLLDNGADPSELLVLTFTRKAAGELKARIGDAAQGMLCGTFHSVALKILREDGAHLGYNPDTITVVDQADAELLLTECCRDLGHLDGKKWAAGLPKDKVKRALESVYTGQPEIWTADVRFGDIFGEYWRRLRDANCLDFGRILGETNALLQNHPDVLAKWQARIKHVLVDELQDSDAVQYVLHNWFAPPGTFFGVGDPRQAIFGFRGARPDLMKVKHPDARVFRLVDCFRSAPDIVEAANTLIRLSDEPYAKDMVAIPTVPEDATETFHGRSADIVERVRQAHERQMFAWSDIAVLARTHRQLKQLGNLMEEADIPYHRVGAGFDICETDEFRLLHAALRLCVNPRDDLSFLRLREAFGLSKADYAAVCKRAAQDGTGHYVAYDAIARDWFNRGERDANPLWNTISQAFAQALAKERGLMFCLDGLLENFDDLDHRDIAPLASMSNLVKAGGFWCDHCYDTPVDEALRWYALRDSQDDCRDGNHVTLSTVHAAKGLEWPCVFVVNMNEGTFPSSRSLREEGGIEPERRVAYVAITRAKERLVAHYRKGPHNKPSRFLAEAGLLESPCSPGVGAKPAPSVESGGAGELEWTNLEQSGGDVAVQPAPGETTGKTSGAGDSQTPEAGR